MGGDDVRLLCAVDLFEPLAREEVERLAWGIPVKTFERGQHVYTPAYRGEMFFMLLRGRVRIYRLQRGNEITLALVEAGEMFGEAAFTTRRRKGAYAETLESSRVALMGRGTLKRLLQRTPRVGLRAMELLSERISLYEERIADMSRKDVPARLASLILELAWSEGIMTREGQRIPVRYTHEQLGSMIGAKRVAVTRAMTRLRKVGAVELRKRYVYVKDADALEQISGAA
jgi:CRP/FNR family cyclic AMP-dependent transcriptional regulator